MPTILGAASGEETDSKVRSQSGAVVRQLEYRAPRQVLRVLMLGEF